MIQYLRLVMRHVSTATLNLIYDAADEEMWRRGEKMEIEKMKTQAQATNDNFCPQCGSREIKYDEDFGFYKCSNCEHCWGYDADDPDYDEIDDGEDSENVG